MTTLHQAIREFLKTYCPSPECLEPIFLEQPGRHRRLHDGQVLCRKGDQADDYWIVLDGEIRIEDGLRITIRAAGDLVGELAFYRGEPGKPEPVRGADMKASRDTTLFRIDSSFVEALSPDNLALWHETVARVLAAKLHEAQEDRAYLQRDRAVWAGLVDRFVCGEGREAALAAIRADGTEAISAEACDVVVWFSDVAGFSTYAEGISPTSAARLIREIMELQIQTIVEAGGQVDKLMGDGLMAFWRAPDAKRRGRAIPAAVQAALAARDRICALARERKHPLDIRIGLHFGRAVLGDFGGGGRIAFTAIGETINTASRYEQAKACGDGKALGRVRLSGAVHELLPEGELKAMFEPAPRFFPDKHEILHRVHSSIDGEAE